MVYEIMFYGGFGLSAVLLLVSGILFWKLRIPSVVGDLTGTAQKKQIRKIKQESAGGGQDNFYSQAVGLRRSGTLDPHSGKVEKRSRSGRLFTDRTAGNAEVRAEGDSASGKTEKTFREQEQKVTEVLEECGSTAKDRRQEAAAEAAATEVLEESAATEVLEEETGAVTQELSEEDGGGGTACPAGKFEIIEEIICVHSEERIG